MCLYHQELCFHIQYAPLLLTSSPSSSASSPSSPSTLIPSLITSPYHFPLSILISSLFYRCLEYSSSLRLHFMSPCSLLFFPSHLTHDTDEIRDLETILRHQNKEFIANIIREIQELEKEKLKQVNKLNNINILHYSKEK